MAFIWMRGIAKAGLGIMAADKTRQTKLPIPQAWWSLLELG
jgi:hypothetical protein